MNFIFDMQCLVSAKPKVCAIPGFTNERFPLIARPEVLAFGDIPPDFPEPLVSNFGAKARDSSTTDGRRLYAAFNLIVVPGGLEALVSFGLSGRTTLPDLFAAFKEVSDKPIGCAGSCSLHTVGSVMADCYHMVKTLRIILCVCPADDLCEFLHNVGSIGEFALRRSGLDLASALGLEAFLLKSSPGTFTVGKGALTWLTK